MSNKVELETISNKIKGLDNELDTFIEVVREIKEISNTVGTLPEDLKQNIAEIEAWKKEIEILVSSSKDMLITFEEQARGVIFDLEKKTDILTAEAKLQISEIKNTARNISNELLDLHKEKIKEIDDKYKELSNSLKTIIKAVDSQESSIDDLKKSHLAIAEKTKTINEKKVTQQKIENRIKKVEEELFMTLARQKNVIKIISTVLIAGIVFAIYIYFIQ